MDFIQIDCAILDSHEWATLHPSSTHLYIHLLRLRQRYGNPFWFNNQRLITITGLSKNTLSKARSQLQSLEFIDYKRGRHSHKSKYTIKIPYWFTS